ncbi:MAG: insulinase family protein [Planctomycetes bacterium]|nr:insulinase family protein [Planctomycetota bacterium]
MTPTTREDPVLHETVVSAELAGGLTAYVIPKREAVRKTAVLGVRYGSIDVDFSPAGNGGAVVRTPPGVAHFLEHQLFKKQSGDLSDEFARFGAYVNAGTDAASTVYHFSGVDGFDQNLEVLLRLVLSPYFARENVDQERKIIEQEIRMYDDQPESRIVLDLLGGLYHRHPVRLDIAGTVASIGGIGPETLDACWRAFYRPANLIFVAAGDLDPFRTLCRVDRGVRRLAQTHGISLANGGAAGRAATVHPEEPETPRGGWTEGKMAVARPKLLLGFKDAAPGVDGAELFAREEATEIALDLCFGRGSGLANRLYDDGLIDDDFAYGYAAHPSFGYTSLGGDTDEPERLRDALLAGIRRAHREGIAKRDFVRMRRKLVGKFIRQFDSAEAAASAVFGYALRGLHAFDAFAQVRRLPLRAVRARLAEHLVESRLAGAVILPNGEEPAGDEDE